jgi:hypothetical protein
MDDPGCWQWVTREEIIQSIPVEPTPTIPTRQPFLPDPDDLIGVPVLAASAASERRMLFGSYGYGGGPITWRDAETGQEIDPATREPLERARVRFVTVPEALAPAAKGKC